MATACRFLRLPEGLHSHEPFAQLVRRARSRLQAEFDDLDAVWASDSLRNDFLKMPLAALLVCTPPLSAGPKLLITICLCAKDVHDTNWQALLGWV